MTIQRKMIAAMVSGVIIWTSLFSGTDIQAAAVDQTAISQAAIETSFGFEDGSLAEWTGRGGNEVLEISGQSHSGANSLKVSGRTQSWNGPTRSVLDVMQADTTYQVSAWVKFENAPASASSISLSVERKLKDADTTYAILYGTTINDTNWVELKGTLSFIPQTEVLNIYVESSNASDVIYIDDIKLTPPGSIQKGADFPALKEVYNDFFEIGAAVTLDQLTGLYKEMLDYHYNSLVAENLMKPEYLSKGDEQYNWVEADQLANYVRQLQDEGEHIELRFHTLLWHAQGSDWMLKDSNGSWLPVNEENKQLALARLEKYIRAAVSRYGDVVTSWDVVNEVIDDAMANGMRQSKWYLLTGEDFIKTAFIVARDELSKLAGANPNAKLYINDYGTHYAKKRDFLYNLVTRLRDEGVPIDGVGHQTHINIAGPSIEEISDSLELFGRAGFDNQLTELDISIYTNQTDSYLKFEDIPQNLLNKQAYRYKELFQELVRLDELGKTVNAQDEGWISNVTLWGIADVHTWLHNNPEGSGRVDAPFPFDGQFQVKPAYYGMVDPSRLPVTPKEGTAAKGTPAIGGGTDLIWSTAPEIKTDKLGTLQAGIKALWDEANLYVRVKIEDTTSSDGDVVDLFAHEGEKYRFDRAESSSIVEIEGGYALDTVIPLKQSGSIGDQVRLDVRISDSGINNGNEQGANGVIVSWSDPRNAQESDYQAYGILNFIAGSELAEAEFGTPEVDGEPDAIWSTAASYHTNVWVGEHSADSAAAEFRTLWDDENLYIYAKVIDNLLSDAGAQPHEQDSVEIFVDQNNQKTSTFESDDGQYRINFNNITSDNGHAKSNENYTSATKRIEGGYTVEAAIALDRIQPEIGTIIGFDFQVNDDRDGDGLRDSVATWSDPTGMSWQNTSRYGVLKLVKKDDEGENPTTPTTPIPTPVASPSTFSDSEFAAALRQAQGSKLVLDAKNNTTDRVTVSFSAAQLQQAAAAGISIVEVKTVWAMLQLPLSLLISSDKPGTALLTVTKKTSAVLSDQARNKIGDNAVLDFALAVNNQQIDHFNNNQMVRVSYPYTLKAGVKPSQIVMYHIDENGLLKVIKNAHYVPETAAIAFAVKHFSHYAAAAVPVSFTDLDQSSWALDAIEAMSAREIVKGVSGDSFAPNAPVTREQYVHMLVQTLDLESDQAIHSFNDVVKGAYYEQSVSIASKLTIVKGQPGGSFDVGASITRQDMAVMTHRALLAAGLPLPNNTDTDVFADHAKISSYANESVSALQQAGLLKGKTNNLFDSEGTASRAEAVSLLYRLLALI